jgi:RHS repeat-associated protein
VHTRFTANPPYGDNADHFICVKYVSGQWEYDNNTNYYAFTPEEGDILMASINFDTDTITSLAGYNSTYGGIAKGYASGNLVYTPNQFGGRNDGEFEVTGTSFTPNKLVIARKYYAGVAMREAGTLYWLLTDHDLAVQDSGSTNVTVTTAGMENAEIRYKAFGDQRFSSGTTPTTMRYTGQREESELGIYFYNARWYDSALGSFIQADTVVSGGAQGFDRYSYVFNNPLRYTDPSGHEVCNADGWCGKYNPDSDIRAFSEMYGITFKGEWVLDELIAVMSGVERVGQALAGYIAGIASNAFRTVFGNMNIWYGDGPTNDLKLGGYFGKSVYPDIALKPGMITARLVVHELGHAFERAIWTKNGNAYAGTNNPIELLTHGGVSAGDIFITGQRPEIDTAYNRNYGVNATDNGYWSDDYRDGWQWHPREMTDGNNAYEDWADIFLNWTYNSFVLNMAGIALNSWVNVNMADWISEATK